MSDRERRLEHLAKMHLFSLESSYKVLGDLVKMLFLFNGGALIAILALLGALAKNGQNFPPAIDHVVRMFGLGLICVVVSALAAWVAQDTQSSQLQEAVFGSSEGDPKHASSHQINRAIGVVLAVSGMIASLVFGMIGMTQSADALGVFAEQVASAPAPPPKS